MSNNIILWLISLFEKKYNLGVSRDTRSEKEVIKDYLHEETATSTLPILKDIYENPPYATYPFENQFSTSSCVAHASTMALQIARKQVVGAFIPLSKAFIYRQRTNYPNEGMYPQQAYELLRTIGSCLTTSLPTPKTESQINSVLLNGSMFEEAKLSTGWEYFRINTLFSTNTIDEIAKIVSQGSQVNITFFSTFKEWAQTYPQVNETVAIMTAPIRHCVTVLPYGALKKDGKRYLVIQDSTPFGGMFIRFVSEDFINTRVYNAIYFKEKTDSSVPITVKPKYTFTKPMSVGSKGTDVLALQQILVYEKILSSDSLTGYFGGRTLAAVKIFQTKYFDEILKPVGINKPTGGVYLSTLKHLNKLYS